MPRRLAMLAFAVALSAQADTDRETLYQISTIDALLTGVYDPLSSIRDVLPHGDVGLGTFTDLDGELILLDGQVYQATADGQVRHLPSDPDIGTPFIAVTHFDADQTLNPPADQDYTRFKTWLEAQFPSRNIVYAIRLDGTFEHMVFRSVPRQSKPYPPLAALSSQQTVFRQDAVTGTLIGFWCPTFMQGVNVPGFHLHFLSADRQQGGHVLDFTLTGGRVQLDPTNGWTVQLPLDPAFLGTQLGADQSEALHAIEQGPPAQ